MRAAVGIGVLCSFVAFALLGCAVQSPGAYERRIQMRELAAGVAPVDDGYHLLVQEKTQGRFACSLAIAKFAPANQAGVVDLVELTPAEEAYWANAVCGISEVRDLQFLSPLSVRPDEPCTDTLCAAAAARGAPLLLLYAPNRYGRNPAQVLGVLYDVKSAQPIASLHASASLLDENDEEVAPDGKRGDHRAADAYFQASREFERHVGCCLGELIRNDSPPPTTQPHRWSTPPEERWWLPRGRRGG
ncbi:MAG: hypothetical protein ACE5I3_03260 [Phycisphaerae bacterium]